MKSPEDLAREHLRNHGWPARASALEHLVALVHAVQADCLAEAVRVREVLAWLEEEHRAVGRAREIHPCGCLAEAELEGRESAYGEAATQLRKAITGEE